MDLKLILESILFNSQKPLTPQELRELLVKAAETSEDEAARSLKKIRNDAIEESLNQLEAEVRGSGRSFELVCVAGCWQFVSKPDYAPWLKTLIGERSRPPRLSQPGLETLAIIAYRQPMTRSEIEQIRGVAVDGVMQTLLERGLVEAVGRAEVVGRPVTYGTTEAFLEYFGLRSLQELPAADELRRIPVTKPPALVTAEPQPAAPVEQLSLEQVEGGAATDPAPAEDPAPPADSASTSDSASPAS